MSYFSNVLKRSNESWSSHEVVNSLTNERMLYITEKYPRLTESGHQNQVINNTLH